MIAVLVVFGVLSVLGVLAIGLNSLQQPPDDWEGWGEDGSDETSWDL